MNKFQNILYENKRAIKKFEGCLDRLLIAIAILIIIITILYTTLK